MVRGSFGASPPRAQNAQILRLDSELRVVPGSCGAKAPCRRAPTP